MHAFYDRPSALAGPIVWAQRQVITANVQADLSARLRYYECARDQNLPHCGAVLAACRPDGAVAGFIDIGRAQYRRQEEVFCLPPPPTILGHAAEVCIGSHEAGLCDGERRSGSDGSGGSGMDGDCSNGDGSSGCGEAGIMGSGTVTGVADLCRGHGSEQSCMTTDSQFETRAYVSNLAVAVDSRRRGVGTLLMGCCEEEVRGWAAPEDEMWLEVTLDNEAALSFYTALGYELVSRSSGREIVRKPFHYELVKLQRGLMRKSIGPRTGVPL
jgi:ribosomal protein S18 acetylase RimI-like enzyme